MLAALASIITPSVFHPWIHPWDVALCSAFSKSQMVVEERASALKELQERCVGSRPLVLQKGVEDGKVGGLNSDDQDLSGEWGREF